MELTADEKQILYKLVKQEQQEHLKRSDTTFTGLLQTRCNADALLNYTSSSTDYERKLDELANKLK